jgi:cytochrome b561
VANNPERTTYPLPAVVIHWIVALCVFGLIPVGVIMSRMDEGPLQDSLFSVHQSIGVLVFVLVIARLAIRASGKMPPPAAALTPFERVASQSAHLALNILLLLTPIIGWLGVSAYGAKVSVFGLFSLPSPLAKDEALSDQIFAVHLACGILIGIVVVAHVVGAIVHAVRRDGVNERMIPHR